VRSEPHALNKFPQPHQFIDMITLAIRASNRSISSVSFTAVCRRNKSTKPRGLRAGLTNYGDPDFSLFLRKAFIKGAGYTESSLSKLIIGIVNTHSAFNPCHGNVPSLITSIKHGVLSTGLALPIEFPTISLHESFSSPTSMYLRNLMSMDTEEMIRAQPMDAVVLIGGFFT
jgi:dihydroxy-acid dehydratase